MLIQVLRGISLILFLCVSSIAVAQDMTSCIRVAQAVKPSTGEEGTFIENTCEQSVFVFWCHDGAGSSACGTEIYFKRGHKMQPNERYFNKYSLPTNTVVHTGACSGSKKNISFSADDTTLYSCIKNNAPIIQPSDHNYIICQDKRKLPYQWRQKYRNGNIAIVRLETAGQVSWLKLNNPFDVQQYQKFENDRKAPPPDIFKSRICGEEIAEPGVIDDLKDIISDGLDNENNDILNECQTELLRSDKCTDFSNQMKNGGSGVQG